MSQYKTRIIKTPIDRSKPVSPIKVPDGAVSVNQLHSQSISQIPLLPGHKLKQIRERQNLSVAEVADMLRLSITYINAIEQDNYESLPGDTFIVAYLRSYSNLLRANANEIIALYRKSLPPAVDEAQEEPSQLQPKESHKSKAWVYPALMSVVAASVIAAGSFFWVQDEEVSPVINTVEVEDADGELVVETIIAEHPSVGGKPAIETTTISAAKPPTGLASLRSIRTVKTQPTAASQRDIPITRISSVVAQEPMRSELRVEESSPSSSSENVEMSIPASIETEKLNALSKPFLASSSGSTVSSLHIEFMEECWVKVVDGNGETVFADLRKAGDVLRLSGHPPLQVKLGNWRAVANLELDSKSVSIPQPSNRDVVQLALAP